MAIKTAFAASCKAISVDGVSSLYVRREYPLSCRAATPRGSIDRREATEGRLTDIRKAKKLLFKRHAEKYASDMATIVEIEKLALTLPEKERATLAANLLDSLPGVLSDEDEGVTEALRRDAELEANPDQAISLPQLDAQIRSRRG